MDLAPQNLQETVTLELEEDPDSFLRYWVGAIGYVAIINLSMTWAFNVELKPYLSSSADAETLILNILTFGYRFSVVPTLSPVITWSVLSYILGFLFNFMMGFWGGWSLFGVYFANLIFSYSDDLIMAALVSMIDDYVTVSISSIYSAFPTYLYSFVLKTTANIGMIYIAAKYYKGWNQHRQFKIAARKAAKAEEASPFSLAF